MSMSGHICGSFLTFCVCLCVCVCPILNFLLLLNGEIKTCIIKERRCWVERHLKHSTSTRCIIRMNDNQFCYDIQLVKPCCVTSTRGSRM